MEEKQQAEPPAEDPLAEHRARFTEEGADAATLAISADMLIKGGEQVWLREVLTSASTPETGTLAILSAFMVNKDISALSEVLILSVTDARVEIRNKCEKALAVFLEDSETHEKTVQWLQNCVQQKKDPEPLLLAALAALGQARELLSVEDLIPFVESADLKIRDQAIASLKTLTYQDFGADQEAWNTWWKDHKHLNRDRIIEPVLLERMDEQGRKISDLKKQRIDLALQIIEGNPDQAVAFLSWDEPTIRQRAAMVISQNGTGERAKEKLAQVIAHLAKGENDGETLKPLLLWLGRQEEKTPESQAILVEYLEKDPRDAIKAAAAKSLEGYKNEAVRQAAVELLGLLAKEKNRQELKEQILDLFAALGGGDDLELIKSFVGPGQGKGVREKAVKALGATRLEEAIDFLGETLVNEPESDIRFEVANSLLKLGKDGTPEDGKKDKAVAALKRGLLDREARVKIACINGIGELEPPGALEIISEHLRSESDPEVRRWCITALGWIHNPRGLEVISKALSRHHQDDGKNQSLFDSTLRAIDAICGDQIELWDQASRLFLSEGHFELAIMCCNNFIEKSKGQNGDDGAQKTIKIRLAEAYVRRYLGDLDFAKALEQVKALLELAPENREYHLFNARILAGLNQAAEAEKAFRMHLNMIPSERVVETWERRLETADYLLTLGNAQGALNLLPGITEAENATLTEDLKKRLDTTRATAKAAVDAATAAPPETVPAPEIATPEEVLPNPEPEKSTEEDAGSGKAPESPETEPVEPGSENKGVLPDQEETE